ncbi:protein translocase subunit yajC [Pedococcus cremeus]|uniref:Protein translocase subunit yajC n=1 Tax=Pedococcus cremeus TaxID=587636 RepID=A0A1H9TVF2_9MICO|nr:preprotein translocase subunit YajC [Pedococcus cremeus]SES00723.1 protein translocase subunit yajC [Pedococcus cremeus]
MSSGGLLALPMATSGGSSGTGLLIFLLPLLLIGWMVFTQRKRQKDAANLQSSIEVGDEVCTTSGLFGTVTAVDATTVTLEVAPNVNVRYDRRAVGMKISTPEAPAPDHDEPGQPGRQGE